MRKLLIAALVLPVLSLHSCKKSDDGTPHLFTAASVKLGNGTVRSWMESDEQNHPKTMGITFDKDAFTNLPTDDEGEYQLALPADKLGIPFNHIVVEWNPHGHPPEHVYDKPHFDIHFYMISENERMAIPEYTKDSTGFLNYPAEGYLPKEYVPIPGGEPMMGAHWVDLTSPEITGREQFTQTFIYGSYNGQVTFYEPMATLDFLTKTSTYTRDIPQPTKFSRDGYYPTKLSYTRNDNGSLDVSLSGFVYRSKS